MDSVLWLKTSNHLIGSAIDINAKQNWFDETVWDIPPEIVKIFREYGFYWGGEYSDTKDAMHFEYKLPYIDIPKFYFPFSSKDNFELPTSNLKRNESGSGGFYPVGLMQNLHAGIHLPVEGNKAEVRCLTNGYIVAARLMGKGQAGDNPVLNKFIGNHYIGFVLVRHDVEKIVDSGENEMFPLYSLYMHLAPPQWDSEDDDYVTNVPWFKKILDLSYGGVVDLDTSSDTIGKNYWATEKISDNATGFKVAGGKTLNAQKDGLKTAVVKPAPEDVNQAVTAFKKGFMVTFSTPVVSVEPGELIGYAEAAENSPKGLIHWELFSPAQDSGLEKLKAIDSDIAALFEKVEETREDNFFDMPNPDGTGTNELEPLLVDKLPPDDQKYMRDIISNSMYSKKLLDFFNNAQSFSDESLDDAKTVDTFSYPVAVTIRNPHTYTGPSEGTPVTLSVSFRKNGADVGKKGTLAIKNFNTMKFTIQVPAAADTLCLESEYCQFTPIPLSQLKPPPAAASSIKPVISCRWRNIIMSHITEWKPEGMKLLLDKLKEEDYLDDFLAMCTLKKNEFIQQGLAKEGDEGVTLLESLLFPMLWWGRKCDEKLKIYGGEHAVCGEGGSESSLFGTMLPADGKIHSIHPVTGTWLLQLLESAGKIKIRNKFVKAGFLREEDNGKLFWEGWITSSATPALGDTMYAAAIQNGYGSGTTLTFLAVKEGAAEPLLLGEAETDDGVALIAKQVGTWGKWTLKVQDTDGKDVPADNDDATQIDIAKPELQKDGFSIKPPAAKSTEYSGTVSFAKGCPKGIDGFLALRYWMVKNGEEPDYSKPAVSYDKTLLVTCGATSGKKETIGGVEYENDYVTGGDGKVNGAEKFTVKEFRKAFDKNGTFQVFLPLCRKLQTIRGEGDEPKIVIKQVADKGRSLTITPLTASNYDKVKTAAMELVQDGVFNVTEKENNCLHLSMPEPAGGSGALAFPFDPSELFDALILDTNPPAGTALFARPTLLLPNGGHDILKELPENQSQVSATSPVQIKALCGNDLVETDSDFTFPPFEKAAFGEPYFTLSKSELIINIPFIGDAEKWKRAEPIVTVIDNHTNTSAVSMTGSIMNANWTIINSKKAWYRKGTTTFTVTFNNPGAFSSEPTFIPISYDATPQLHALPEPLIREDAVIIRGTAQCMFTDIDLEIICQKKVNELWETDTHATDKVVYTGYEGKKYGRCDMHGNFKAKLPRDAVEDEIPRRFVWKRKYGGKVHGIQVEDVISKEFILNTPVVEQASVETNKG